MSRFTRLIAICGTAAGMVALGSVSAASAGTHPGSSATAARAAALSALRHLLDHSPATDQRLPGTRPGLRGATKVQSSNWSGYADNHSGSHTYSRVSAQWTEPRVSCTSATQFAAFWVGIDGFASKSVEQDGTLAECSKGHAYYFTWWEMYPSNSIQVVGQDVAPGDHITALVTRSGTSYHLTVADSTTGGNNVNTTQRCGGCVNSSAEWIAEAPSGSGRVLLLADFGTWKVSSASVTSGSKTGVISTFPDDEITMVDSGGHALSTPSSLSSSGASFSATWHRSQ